MSLRYPPLVAEIDLGHPLPWRIDVGMAGQVRVLVRLHGRPLGVVRLVAKGTRIHRQALARAIEMQLGETLIRQVVVNGLGTPGQRDLELVSLLGLPEAPATIPADMLTAIVCTTGAHPESVDACVRAIVGNVIPPAEVLVVEHGPDATERPVDGSSKDTISGERVRRIVAPGVDLEQARRLAMESARTPLVAFVDDQARVDPGWVGALCRTFLDYPQAAAVIGSIVPDGAQTEPSCFLDAIRERMAWCGPLEFRWFRLRPDETMPRAWFNAFQFGSAANMAFRRDVLQAAGGFEAVAGGAASGTSQHLDLFLRMLDARHGIVREPAACARIKPPTSMQRVGRDVHDEAAGISAALMAAAFRRSGRTLGSIIVAQWFLRTALVDFIRHGGVERKLAWARLRGHLAGTWRGLGASVARLLGRKARLGAPPPPVAEGGPGIVSPFEVSVPPTASRENDGFPVASTPGSAPVADLLALWHGKLLGPVSVVTAGHPVSHRQVHRLLLDSHWDSILSRHLGLLADAPEYDGVTWRHRADLARDTAHRLLREHLLRVPRTKFAGRRQTEAADPLESVTIVIPTRDRPADLRECLHAVTAQKTSRQVEVVVVDNHSESGLTAPVLADFPSVRTVAEPRRGAAYARNRGLLAARGAIIVCIDDDVTVPDGWLERLLAPLADPSVAVVTGNIVPRSLATTTERITEECCSLSAGLEPFTVDGSWFEASPTAVQGWDFGTTAHMAVRSRVFSDRSVGMFAESLGPGTPVGAGEDPYFLYRVLRAGYTLRYLPDVWVWHKHRTSPAGLRRLVYAYAKSAVAYHLMALYRDGDRRSRQPLMGGLQRHYLRRVASSVRGGSTLPWWIVATEVAGHVAGVFAFVASVARRRMIDRDPRFQKTPPALPRRTDAKDAVPKADSAMPRASLSAASAPRPANRAAPSREVMTTLNPRHDDAAPYAGRLPHFLVIGAQKAGTTALNSNLRKHPGIELVPRFSHSDGTWDNTKETHFFAGWGQLHGVNSLEDYRALFNADGKLQGEVCPSYDSARALDAIAATIPDVRLIFICREPVARLGSAFNHMMQRHAESPLTRPWNEWSPSRTVEENMFRELADASRHGLLKMGIYADVIEHAWKRFGRDRLLILVAEDYRSDPQGTYDRIFAFLDLPTVAIRHRDVHVRRYDTHLTPAQREVLADFYRPHNERLFELLGRRIPSWTGSPQDREASPVSRSE